MASESHAKTLLASIVRLMTKNRLIVTDLARFPEARFWTAGRSGERAPGCTEASPSNGSYSKASTLLADYRIVESEQEVPHHLSLITLITASRIGSRFAKYPLDDRDTGMVGAIQTHGSLSFP